MADTIPRERLWRALNKSRNTSLGNRIKLADTTLSRFVGLIGKRNLARGSGLWIVPSNGVHTFGMMFPIDVIFIDGNYRVVQVRENLRPFWVTRLNWKARSVLELPVTTIDASETKVGDYLVLDSEK